MGIWGKILGSTAGLMIGGPLGALMGGLAGHAYDRIKNTHSAEDQGKLERQGTFATAVNTDYRYFFRRRGHARFSTPMFLRMLDVIWSIVSVPLVESQLYRMAKSPRAF